MAIKVDKKKSHTFRDLCSIATDNMSLSKELQNAISVISVVQTSTLKTAKEFEFGFLHKKFNLFETSGVRTTYSKFRHATQSVTYHTANINRH
jgi:hypothetical protein